MDRNDHRPAPGLPRRWLLAVDGSEHSDRCARYVARWAGPLGAGEVCIVNSQAIGSFRAFALNRDRMLRAAAEQAAHATENARRMLDAAGVRYRVHTGHDEPAQTILDTAVEQQADEILLGTRGLGPLTRLALGSVAYKVMHLASAVVTATPPAVIEHDEEASQPPQSHRLLLAVDGSTACRNAVAYVCGLAATGRVELDVHLANVQPTAAPTGDGPAASHDAIGSRERDAGRATLASAEEVLGKAGIHYTSHLVAGHPAEVIVHLAIANRCARVVMGSRGVGMIEQIALGSVSYNVLHRAPVPVTVVK